MYILEFLYYALRESSKKSHFSIDDFEIVNFKDTEMVLNGYFSRYK